MATLAPPTQDPRSLGLSKEGTVEFDRSQFGPPDIGSHEITYKKKIGGGCFGSVWLGECRGLPVAVKKLFKQDLSPKSLSDFKREVEFSSRLNHPNVLLFMGACTEPGNMAIVMELMERGNLEQLLHNKHAVLSLFRRMQMAKDVAKGMNWLHCSNPAIIHRDLKPSNLLVDKHGTIKVCDFGLSDIKPDTGKLKDKDNIPGTPLWMAPEVMLGRPLDEKSDVYSFGIVLWEIVTRKVPFPDMKSFPVFKRKVCFENVRPPVSEAVPVGIRDLIQRTWHRNPEIRPGFGEIITMIDDLLVDCAINNVECREFWRKYYSGEDSVKYASFADNFCDFINESDDNPIRQEVLKVLMSQQQSDQIMRPEDVVHIETLGRVVDWFGPLQFSNEKKGQRNIVDKMVGVCKQPWFHGNISKDTSENLLRHYREGYFLVRLSTTNAGGYTISRVAPCPPGVSKPPIIHHRISYKIGTGFSVKYSMGSGNPAKEVRSSPTTSLRSFIKSIAGDLFLETPVPGSPYKYIFGKVRAGECIGYEEDMTEI